MQLTRTVTVVEVVWVLVALLGLAYGIRVVRDALKVLRVIRNEADNDGLERIAKLLVVTTSILVSVFVIFLGAAVLSMTIPTPKIVTPSEYVRQALFVSVGVALAYSMFYTHRVRQRVLTRDMADKDVLTAAVTEVERQFAERQIKSRVELTVATDKLRVSTDAATDVMQNGGLAAQIDATRAIEEQTAQRVSDAQALLVAAEKAAQEHDVNTRALNEGTVATDKNTTAVDRSTDHHRHRDDQEV